MLTQRSRLCISTPILWRRHWLCRRGVIRQGMVATLPCRLSSGRLANLVLCLILSAMAWGTASAEPSLMPHRPLLRGFGGLCDGGPLPCTHIDQIAFNVGADAIVLPSTSLRGLGFVTSYGFSVGIWQHIEGGIFSNTAIWGQPSQTDANQTNTLWQQGPVRFAVKGLVWPFVNPLRSLAVLVEFEYEARLPHFDGQNQLGLLTDLGALRAVVNLPLGLAELGVSAGGLFDWQDHYGTAEVGARAGLHLPFLPDVKVFAEGLARGFISRVRTDSMAAPLPGALDPMRPIVPGGALGFGIISRTKRQVDFSMVVHVGFGDVAPFFLTLRFADVAWGEGYPRPQSIVVDAIREFAQWVQEQVTSIDPIFSDTCLMLDDAPEGQLGKSMDLLGHRTQDREHCIWNGLWLRGDKDAHYWKNKRGTILCYDKARNHCFAERASSKEPWQPLESPAHTALLRKDCIFEDADTKRRLTHFGTLTPDGRSCTDGTTTFQVGQHTAYSPELRQIDRGMQSTTRQHPPLEYEGEPKTFQRLATALGRGIEAGQQENREADDQTTAQAVAGDKKIDAARQKIEQMTSASIANGIEAAEQEAEADIRHAGADPKGTFNRALAQIRQGLENAAVSVKDGVTGTAQRVKEGVVSTTLDVTAWAKEPALEEAEDLLKLGGRKAATAPRDVTINVATGMATGVSGKLLGGVLEGVAEGKAGKRLLGAVEKEEAKYHHPELPPHHGQGGPGGAPHEPYNRRKHYGDTPQKPDRRAVGGESVDHDPPLVKRYYEGDPATGEPPGYQLSQEQRRASANDRSRMRPSTTEEQRRQGGQMSGYSKGKKQEHGL